MTRISELPPSSAPVADTTLFEIELADGTSMRITRAMLLSALSSAITDHIADASDAHAASAIAFTPTGTIAATTAQAAIAEVATDAAAGDALKVAKAGDTMTGTLTLSGAPVIVAGATPQVILNETDQPADARRFEMIGSGGLLILRSVSDAGVAQVTAMTITRAGVIGLNGAGVTGITLPTVANDVTIGKASPTLSLDATGASDHAQLRFRDGGVTRWVLINEGTANALQLQRYDAAGAYLGNTIVINNATNNINLGGAATVWVPANTGSSQPAQVTAYDATTGRLAIAGVESGNTGWRAVDPTMQNSWTISGGGVLLRRHGSTVTLQTTGSILNGTAATATQFMALPSGFRPQNYAFGTGAQDSGTIVTYPIRAIATGGVEWRATAYPIATLTAGRFGITFQTNDAWPTTLPGTQSTPPFTG